MRTEAELVFVAVSKRGFKEEVNFTPRRVIPAIVLVNVCTKLRIYSTALLRVTLTALQSFHESLNLRKETREWKLRETLLSLLQKQINKSNDPKDEGGGEFFER